MEGGTGLDDVGLDHFPKEVVALAGTLAHAGEHGESVVLLGDIVDQLLDKHGLAHAGAAEQADLSSLEVRLEQVDDLDAGEEDFLRSGEVLELGRLAVDREPDGGIELTEAVNGLSRDVHDAAADVLARGHRDWSAGGDGLHATAQAVGGVHGDAAHGVLADVLLHLDDELTPVGAYHVKRFMDGREWRIGAGVAVTDIYNRTYDLGNMSYEF